jgi:hypothetical protein
MPVEIMDGKAFDKIVEENSNNNQKVKALGKRLVNYDVKKVMDGATEKPHKEAIIGKKMFSTKAPKQPKLTKKEMEALLPPVYNEWKTNISSAIKNYASKIDKENEKDFKKFISGKKDIQKIIDNGILDYDCENPYIGLALSVGSTYLEFKSQ